MKQHENYIYLPSAKVNDLLNTGNNITGKIVMTKKYIMILPDKVQDAIGLTDTNLYDPAYFNSALKNMDNIDLVGFETEMLFVFFFCHCHKRNKNARENKASSRLNQNN